MKYGVRSPKDVLWLEFYERALKEWKGKRKLTKAFFAIKTAHLKKDEDWFFLKSLCEQEEKRGVPFMKTFWSSIKDYGN